MPRTLVFLHAHPDDEALLTAGTMARAAAEGHRVVLVVATAGEAGLAAASVTGGPVGAGMPPVPRGPGGSDDPRTHAGPTDAGSRGGSGDLGAVRTRELAQSAAALGVARTVLLGYPDSGLRGDVTDGFSRADPADVAAQVAALLDEERADVLVGYDPSGGYGHPDHLQVHRVARLARESSAHRPLLFEATLPREPIAGAVGLAAALRLTPSDFDPTEFSRAWTPRSQITHRVDVRRHLAAKRASLAAHASQATADGTTRTLAVLGRLPGPVFAALLGTEFYVAVP